MYCSKLSILIPSYNDAKFLTLAVASALQVKCVGEIIVIDDCSVDETQELIQRLSQNEKKIKYFRNEKNSGTSYSFFRAFEKSKYDYIQMLNSDDFFIPKNVDKLFNFVVSNKLDLAYGKLAIKKKKEIFRFQHPGYYKESYINSRNEFRDLLIFDLYINPAATIIKKEILFNFFNYKYIKDLDKNFGVRFKAHDYDLFLNLADQKKKIGFLNEVITVWKPEETSQSGVEYINSGAAMAESCFLFNRYYRKEKHNFDSNILKKIKDRINKKVYVTAFTDNESLKKIFLKHFKKFKSSVCK